MEAFAALGRDFVAGAVGPALTMLLVWGEKDRAVPLAVSRKAGELLHPKQLHNTIVEAFLVA